jgi:anti-sigma factor ChrR (cupin superfamily)
MIFLNSINKKSQKSTIAGIVIPDQWDATGKVITVTIHTNDEKVFLVEHTKIGNDLLNHIHKEVDVTGKIRERVDGKTSIGIKSYKTANN